MDQRQVTPTGLSARSRLQAPDYSNKAQCRVTSTSTRLLQQGSVSGHVYKHQTTPTRLSVRSRLQAPDYSNKAQCQV
ncbi:hypothetical protein BgiBS90_002554 [Biomphalaria glabrata]|nr:hypothetical protein BgiBS90_002554 [Biomphalaria glabrata]